MEQYGLSNIVVHAPYIINIGNTTKPEVYELGVNFLQNEIERTQAIGAKDIVLHPGAHVGAGADKGINQIIKGLNEVLTHDVRLNCLKQWLEKEQKLDVVLKNLLVLLMV